MLLDCASTGEPHYKEFIEGTIHQNHSYRLIDGYNEIEK